MYRSPPHPPNTASAFVSGDVTIDPGAAIATGAILQADDPESQIVIAGGVCIGMGAIVHAYQGRIEIEAGATIGAGVLVVGRGTIGAKACIGAETTLLNPAIAPRQVVPANAIVGDESRSVNVSSASPDQPDPGGAEAPPVGSPPEETPPEGSPWDDAPPEDLPPEDLPPEDLPSGEVRETAPPSSSALSSTATASQALVYGQVHLNHLLNTLLPHRKSLNNSKPSDRSS